MRWLLEAGAATATSSRAGQRNALHLAASKGREAVVRALMATSSKRRSAGSLDAAVAGESAPSSSAVKSTGKELVSSRDAAGCTALHMAALHSHVGCCRLLLEGGADVTAVDALGRVAQVHWCGELSVWQALLESASSGGLRRSHAP